MGSKYKNTSINTGSPLGLDQLEKIDYVLCHDFAKCGVQSVLLLDMSGNIISKYDDGNCGYDIRLFAALASANFAAVDCMARTVGEKEFSLLFHKGKHSHTHFSKISDDILLVATFGTEVPIGALRQKIDDVTKKLKRVWGN